MGTPVVLRDLTERDLPLIERLWQLYSHDMSEVRRTVPDAEGRFKPGRLPGYLGDPDCRGYLVWHQDAPVGFAFVVGASGPLRKMGDFFVVRGVRRQGIASQMARALLAQHPGRWEIAFQAGNPGAPEFWRRVATDAVGAGWVEELRPVPNKPHIPDDHFIVLTTAPG